MAPFRHRAFAGDVLAQSWGPNSPASIEIGSTLPADGKGQTHRRSYAHDGFHRKLRSTISRFSSCPRSAPLTVSRRYRPPPYDVFPQVVSLTGRKSPPPYDSSHHTSRVPKPSNSTRPVRANGTIPSVVVGISSRAGSAFAREQRTEAPSHRVGTRDLESLIAPPESPGGSHRVDPERRATDSMPSLGRVSLGWLRKAPRPYAAS